MNFLGIALFVFAYALLSAGSERWLGLGRPAVALIGAVAFVATGVLSPSEAIAAVHLPTLLLLLGVMGMGAFLAQDGFFDAVEPFVTRISRTPQRLLGAVVWGAGALSALITNDAVCVLATPILVRTIRAHRLPPLPYLLALATAANTGSAATLVGNPQNMLCAQLGHLSFLDYSVTVIPITILGLAVNHSLLAWLFRRSLKTSHLQPTNRATRVPKQAWFTLAAIAGTAIAYTLGSDLAWTAACGFAALLVLKRRLSATVWKLIDWPLLLFFAGLFVLVRGFQSSGGATWLFDHVRLHDPSASHFGQGLRLATAFLFGSNIVSNVPFILIVQNVMTHLPDPKLGWTLLAVTSTFAGNLTLLGSVANLIVAEGSREVGGISFWQYLRVGLPLGILTAVIAVVCLYALPF